MTDAVATSVGDLALALRAALIFADEHDGWPDLSAVYLEAGSGRLTATATNRHVLGQASITASGVLPRGALLGRDHAQLLADHLEEEYVADVVTLTPLDSIIGGARIRIEHAESQLAIEVPDLARPEGERPWLDYQLLFQKFDASAAASDLTVGSMLLAPDVVRPIGQLAGLYQGLPARWTFLGPLEPVRVELGGAFTAVLMPAKPTDQTATFWPILAAAGQA